MDARKTRTHVSDGGHKTKPPGCSNLRSATLAFDKDPFAIDENGRNRHWNGDGH